MFKQAIVARMWDSIPNAIEYWASSFTHAPSKMGGFLIIHEYEGSERGTGDPLTVRPDQFEDAVNGWAEVHCGDQTVEAWLEGSGAGDDNVDSCIQEIVFGEPRFKR